MAIKDVLAVLASDSADFHLFVKGTENDQIATNGGIIPSLAGLSKQLYTSIPNSIVAVSTTSVAIALGPCTLTVAAGKSFATNQWVTITADAQHSMAGVVTSYSGTTLVVNISKIIGSGTFGNWQVSVSSIPGADGIKGTDGLKGDPGVQGNPGVDGKTIRSGSGVPSNSLGVSGDYYIDTAASILYGPKGVSSWPAGISIVGPQGNQGVPGNPGVDGKTLRYGSGAPAAGVGVIGDFYLDTAALYIYGPKAVGGWPAGVSMAGPQGNPGVPGTSILSGAPNPVSGTGNNGDFYLNTSTSMLYGPKAAGVWPAGVSLVGAAGVNGNTIRTGSGVPAAGTGANGDFYIDTVANNLYGPKAAGAWPAGVSLVGPAGLSGTIIRSGAGAPAAGVGVNGDFYIDTTAWYIYGPKAAGAWPAGTSIVGPAGTGSGGSAFDPNAAQILTNTRVKPRVLTISSFSATPTINTDLYDEVILNPVSGNITSMTTGLTGTPSHGESIVFYFKPTASVTIGWGTKFVDSSIARPTGLTNNVQLAVSFTWNSIDAVWRCTGYV